MSAEVELIEHITNCAVVRVHPRRFPGVVVQGDTLDNLLSLAERAEQRSTPGTDAADALAMLREDLTALRDTYVSVPRRHGWTLPFEERAYTPPADPQ